MRNHSASSQFTAYTIIAIVSAIVSFITMIVLTRISSEIFFGKINKFITASNVIMSLICLGLDSAYIRFYYEPPENTNSRQLAWKCMFPAFCIFVFASSIIFLLRNNTHLALLIGGEGTSFTIAFIITIFSQFLNRFLTIFFRMSSRVLSFSIASISFVLLTKTIFIPCCLITPEYETNIIVMSVFFAAFMSSFFWLNHKKMIEISRNSFLTYKPVYRYALFSSPVIVVVYLNSYFPQIIISDKLGDAILGVYSAAMLFCLGIQVLSTGFTTFWSPYMYKNYKTENENIKKIHDVVLLGCVMVLSLVLLFSDVFYMFIGEIFRKSQNILGMLLIYPLVVILVETTAYGISIKKKNEITLIIYLISTMVNAILCYGLTSKYGLAGVAIASMIAGIIHMILMTYFGQKYYRSIESTFRTLIHTIILIFSAVLFYLYYDNRMVFVIAELIMVTICLFYDKNVILWGFRIIKQNRNK